MVSETLPPIPYMFLKSSYSSCNGLTLRSKNVLGIYLAFILDGSMTALGIQFLLAFNITDTLLRLIGAVSRDLTNLVGINSLITKVEKDVNNTINNSTIKPNHSYLYVGEDSSEAAEKAREKMNKLISEVNYLTKEFILTICLIRLK